MKFFNLFISSVIVLLNQVSAVDIDAVYFAQTHVMKPTDPYFKLVGERDTLIKVHATDALTPALVAADAVIHLDGATLNLPLAGPATLPSSVPDGPGVVQHSFSDSYTAVIPGAWVKPGMTVDVTVNAATENVTGIAVGAPTKLKLTMFDIQYFADTNDDYPSGWAEELEAKLPIKELDLRRVPHVVFPELVIPPWEDWSLPAVRINSRNNYKEKMGVDAHFEAILNAAKAWNNALREAAGLHGRVSVYYSNIYGTNSNGGKSSLLTGIGNGTEHGVMFHELGHTLGLPHWGDSRFDASYPYRGVMHGIDPPADKKVHAGPTWAFDMPSKTFIPSTVQADNVEGYPAGTYKIDPMHGGGTGYQEPDFLFNHFSDYSAAEMFDFLEANYASWNEFMGQFATWDSATSDYTKPLATPNGVNYPIERDVEVISLLASVSGPTPEACTVYPPIGPYRGDLIKRFDPSVEADRIEARATGYSPSAGCDTCIRVTQGGVVSTYLLRAEWLPHMSPSRSASMKTAAINLPASDGAVTRLELLLTPDADSDGLPESPRVLHTWALNPTPFDHWADGSFPAILTDRNSSNDADGGGMATELEWVLMGNPTDGSDDLSISPELDMAPDPNGKLLFRFRRNDLAHADGNTSIRVQYGSDLTGWTDASHQGSGPGDITITESDDAYGAGVDMVTVAFPRGLVAENTMFARLRVEVTVP